LLGIRISMLRKNARMSQKELAKGIISVSHLSNLEANRYKASIETIELLAKRLNVLSSYLINYSKENDILRERIISLKEGIILNLGNVNKIINDITLPIENTELEISYYLLKASFYYKTNQFDLAVEINNKFISYYDNFLNNSLESLPDVLKQSTLYYSGMKNYRVYNLSESNKYFNRLLGITSNNSIKANLHYNIALINHNQSNRIGAFENANTALNLYIELQQWKKIGELYNFLGVVYREASLAENAMQFFDKSMNISVQMNLESIKERIFHNKGLVLEDMEDYEGAIKNFKLSYDLKMNNKKNNSLFLTVRCLIRCYIKTNDISMAKKLTKESLANIENPKQFHILKALEAEIHYIEKDYESFLEKLIKSINYLNKHNYFKEIIGLNTKIADFYFSQKKYKSAAIYYKQELEFKNFKKG